MKITFSLALLLPFSFFAQLPDSPKPQQTWFSLSAGTQLRKQLHSGLDAQLSVQLTPKWRLEGQSFLSVAERFDRSRQWENEYEGTNKTAKTLWYNQSALTGIRQIASRRIEKTVGYRQTALSIRAGYSYNQQGLSNTTGRDFYLFDVTAEGERRIINGIRTHALSAGLDLSFMNTGNSYTLHQRVYADALVAVNMHYTAFRTTADNEFYDTKIDDSFSRDLFGAQLGYELRWYGSGRLGFLFGVEASWRPSINYEHNHDFYVPRGGEGLTPFAASVKAGMTYRL